MQAAQQLAEEPLGSAGIAPALNQNVEHAALLVDGTPEVMQLAPDADEHLIEMPFVAGTWPMPLQRVGELLPEAKAPLTEPIIEVRSDERCAGLAADGLVRFTAGAARDEAEGSSPPKLLVVCGAIMASYGGSFGLFDTLLLPLAVDAAAAPGLHGAFSLLLTELSCPGVGTRVLAEALMTQCLVLLLRRELARNGGSQLFVMLHDARLARAVTSVLERSATPYTVASLAAIAGMSRTSFAMRFQATYGETPLNFVQRVRLRHAATLLRTTALPVKVIAAAVGFASRSHFSRAFHAAYGIEPRGYRQIKLPGTGSMLLP